MRIKSAEVRCVYIIYIIFFRCLLLKEVKFLQSLAFK